MCIIYLQILGQLALRKGIADVAFGPIFITILFMSLSVLHCNRKVDSRIFSNSTKETVPLRYILQTQGNDDGSDISRVLGTRSRT